MRRQDYFGQGSRVAQAPREGWAAARRPGPPTGRRRPSTSTSRQPGSRSRRWRCSRACGPGGAPRAPRLGSPKQTRLIEDACVTHGIEFYRGTLQARCQPGDELVQVVTRVAQAAFRVSDLWFTFRTQAVQTITDEVADFLTECEFEFARAQKLVGRSGRGWSVDFHVRTERRSSLVHVLSTGNRAAAHRVSEHVLAEWHDLNHLVAGPEAPLCGIARELAATVRGNVTIDWTLRENVRSHLRRLVKRILRKHGYPPDKQESATRTVLDQAEVFVCWLGEVKTATWVPTRSRCPSGVGGGQRPRDPPRPSTGDEDLSAGAPPCDGKELRHTESISLANSPKKPRQYARASSFS